MFILGISSIIFLKSSLKYVSNNLILDKNIFLSFPSLFFAFKHLIFFLISNLLTVSISFISNCDSLLFNLLYFICDELSKKYLNYYLPSQIYCFCSDFSLIFFYIHNFLLISQDNLLHI